MNKDETPLDKVDIPLRFKDRDLLKKLFTLMASKGRDKLLKEHSAETLTEIVILHPDKDKPIKVFEGNHLQQFAQIETPPSKYIDGKNLRKELIKKLGTDNFLKDFSIDLSVSLDRPKKLFGSLVTVLGISETQCLLEFLEFCKEEHRPLRVFDTDEQRNAYIADLREHFEEYLLNLNTLPPNPYKGLEVFGLEDRKIFFGRDKWIKTLCDKLNETPFLAVIGASGSGKSSLMFAGVAQKFLNNDCLFIHFRPSSGTPNDPFSALASSLVPLYVEENGFANRAIEQEKTAKALKSGSVSLTTCIDIINDKQKAKRILIYIDQFEELFTLDVPSNDRTVFIKLLVDFYRSVSKNTDMQAVVALTMRSDFLLNANVYVDFAEMISHHSEIIHPPNRDDLRLAIKMPAKNLNVEFEEGLIDSILTDAELSTGGLPLVEYALAELWETQKDETITHLSYHKIGRISGALGQRAEKVFNQLDEQEQKDSERIFIKLVSARDGNFDTRRVAKREEFTDDEWQLIHKLSSQKHRLLVVDTDENQDAGAKIELSHETLITQWARLGKWLEKNRSFMIWRGELGALMNPWLENKENKSNLLRGDALIIAEQWLKKHPSNLNALESEFILDSIAYAYVRKAREIVKKAKEDRLRKILITTFAGISAIFIGLTFFLESALDEAKIQANKTQTNLHRFIAEKSVELAEQGESRLAALLALETLPAESGIDTSNTDYAKEAIKALKKIDGKYLETKRIQTDEKTSFFDVSSDAKKLVTATTEGKVTVWSIDTGTKLIELTGHTNAVTSVAFNSDDSKIISISGDGSIGLWGLSTGRNIFLKQVDGPAFKKAELFENSNILITQDDYFQVSVWQLSQLKNIKTQLSPLNSWKSEDFYFDEENSALWLNTFGDLKKIIIRDGSYSLVEEWHLKDVKKIILSPKLKYALLYMKNFGYKVGLLEHLDNLDYFSDLTIKDKNSDSRIGWTTRLPANAIFDEMGNTIILGRTRAVYAFDLHSGNRVITFDDGKFLHGHIDLSADSSRLLTFSYGGEINVSDNHSGNSVVTFDDLYSAQSFHNSTLPKFTGKTTTVAALDVDGLIRFWSQAVFPEEKVILFSNSKEVSCANFSDNSSLIATCSEGNQIRIWSRESGKLKNVLKGHEKRVNFAVFNSDNSKIITASDDGTARLWDISTGKEIHRIRANRPIQAAFFSDDEKSIMAASMTSEFFSNEEYFEYRFKKNIDQLGGHNITNGEFYSLSILNWKTDDTSALFLSRYSHFFRYLRQKNSRGLFYYVDPDDDTRSYGPISISHNGELEAQTINFSKPQDKDGNRANKYRVIVTNVRTEEEVFRLSSTSNSRTKAIGFSENSQYMYTISPKYADIFSMTSGENIRTIPVDKHEEIDALFSYNAKYLIILTEQYIQIWDVFTGELAFKHSSSVGAIRYVMTSPDSKDVMWLEGDGRFFISPIQLFDNAQLIKHYRNLGLQPLTPEERKRFFLLD